jgi:ribosome assembly protein 1
LFCSELVICLLQDGDTENADEVVTISTPNKQSTVKIRAVPLPTEVTDLLDSHSELLKALDKHLHSKSGQQNEEQSNMKTENCPSRDTNGNQTVLTERTLKAIQTLKEKLKDAFAAAGNEWKGAENQIWSVGPRRCGPNILLNRVPTYDRPSVWQALHGSDPRLEYDSSFVSGFQLATLAGPLCEEPMMGVCFVVEDWTLVDKSQLEQLSARYNSTL